MDPRSIKAIRNTATDELYSISDVCNRIGSIKSNMTHELLVSYNQSTDLIPAQVGLAVVSLVIVLVLNRVFRRGNRPK